MLLTPLHCEVRTPRPGSRPEAARAARGPRYSQSRLSPAPQLPRFPPAELSRLRAGCHGDCPLKPPHPQPPHLAQTQSAATFAPRASRVEGWGGELRRHFSVCQERTLQQSSRRRDKLFFSLDATITASFRILQPQREHAWGFRGNSGWGGKRKLRAPVPSSKMAPSGPAQKRGRSQRPQRALELWGHGSSELAEQPSAPGEPQLAATSNPSARSLSLDFCLNRMAILNIHIWIQSA